MVLNNKPFHSQLEVSRERKFILWMRRSQNYLMCCLYFWSALKLSDFCFITEKCWNDEILAAKSI